MDGMHEPAHAHGDVAPARRRLSWTATMVLVVGGLIGSTAIVAADHNPGGRNGTIKISPSTAEMNPDNDPHPGCQFDVDFYGFDAGETTATLRFYAWPPTGNRELRLTDTATLDGDSADGGGSLRGYDGSSRLYTAADVAHGAPHPQQGWHVKLVVTTNLGTVKQKVFWVECPGYEPPPYEG